MKHLAVAIAAVSLSACGLGSPPGETREEWRGMSSWRDPESGCRYLIWREWEVLTDRDYGGITPALNADGKPDCSPVEEL